MAIIIDGKLTAAVLKEQLSQQIESFYQRKRLHPGLAVIMVGNNPASAVYVRNKANACQEVGIYSHTFELPEDAHEEDVLDLIKRLNIDSVYHGILVQLPLPKHISEEKIIAAIAPEKDVDAFHPYNVGRIMTGNYDFVPCTPAGVMALLDNYRISVEGKRCVVVGRSNIVGKPQSLLLLERSGTVTVCHSKTENLAEITRTADILVVAIGKPNFITADMVKEGATVIDVGINRLENGKLCGDVDYEEVAKKAYAITPVPGGVGPMTVTMLLYNTFRAAQNIVVY